MCVHSSEARSHAVDSSRYVKALIWGLVPSIPGHDGHRSRHHALMLETATAATPGIR
ncbi:MAG TPA: hypothetical protein VIG79_03490 [Lapillicoccus sp.]|jgi:hypothetical protein